MGEFHIPVSIFWEKNHFGFRDNSQSVSQSMNQPITLHIGHCLSPGISSSVFNLLPFLVAAYPPVVLECRLLANRRRTRIHEGRISSQAGKHEVAAATLGTPAAWGRCPRNSTSYACFLRESRIFLARGRRVKIWDVLWGSRRLLDPRTRRGFEGDVTMTTMGGGSTVTISSAQL